MGAKQTRRQFLQKVGIGAAASLMTASSSSGQDQPLAEKEGLQGKYTSKRLFELGLASYTFRGFDIDTTLAMTQRLELKYIALKSFHLPLESTQTDIETVTAKIRQAGLKLYGAGVIYMNDEAEVHRTFGYAKTAGLKVIIGVPKPELLGLVNKKVGEHDIQVAIHNHGPEDKIYPTPESVYKEIKELDSRIGLCIDIGHTQRAGVDPSEAIEKFAERLLDLHIKDVSAATAEGTTVEMGRGVIDIPKVVRTLLKLNYAGIASFEFEKDEKDPLPGVAESVGYIRGVLATI